MAYIDGFVVPVPLANKNAYLDMAKLGLPLFKEYGAVRVVECWGDDVPEGKVTDFRRAVQAKPEETVVFSWIEWPSKAVRDAGQKKMIEDERMTAIPGMPFDGQRMIYGGFAPFAGPSGGGKAGYVDGAVIAVPAANKAAYRDRALAMAEVFKKHGATCVVDAWGDDVPEGKVTDFQRAVKVEDGETVVFSWIEWPSKAVRDVGWEELRAEPLMQPGGPTLFDGKRMIHGAFAPILDQ
ncbi:MAG: DUF1428 domain-containing protein [Hyphomonadaceae bacterium]|nr:DUF1428 domain-containing protein [Hyphomonadaceae bacterium]